MEQKDKELLLKDLCARLPYGIKAFAKTPKGNKIGKVITITTKFIDYSNGDVILGELYTDDECFWLDYGLFKPYLRPMSSMTPDEFEEFTNIVEHISIGKLQINIVNSEAFDWLNAHHFDYRGLIEKGLALEAPDGMYNIN